MQHAANVPPDFVQIESQEIDRYLECLSSVYYDNNCQHPYWGSTAVADSQHHHPTAAAPPPTPPPPMDPTKLLLLFYSVLMLQTSIHNDQAARTSMGKRTVQSFVRNTQGRVWVCVCVPICVCL